MYNNTAGKFIDIYDWGKMNHPLYTIGAWQVFAFALIGGLVAGLLSVTGLNSNPVAIIVAVMVWVVLCTLVVKGARKIYVNKYGKPKKWEDPYAKYRDDYTS